VSLAAASYEKDVETMPTQKIFKQRVRARMTKTGESYTAARRQLLNKASEAAESPPSKSGVPEATAAIPADALLVADEAMERATGKRHAEWFALLDEWGATEHTHTEIARWLSETHGFLGWWVQNVTVAYERVRGMRAPHQMHDGFSISVSRTVDADPARALGAFTDASIRPRWLPDAGIRQRPTRAALLARFDWADPPSRLVVSVAPKAPGKAIVTVGHEKLPDAESAAHFKAAWRGWLGELKSLLERV
jgi:uncharacterized protein YndB with AHSA1/START domain